MIFRFEFSKNNIRYMTMKDEHGVDVILGNP
nr:MAG TPA: Eco57I restriction-modification methylase [Caudoviricetes sp.]DAV69914.1 MAG TPA: Eco57I restriction-modification methylase [Caudoviricetes sp.]